MTAASYAHSKKFVVSYGDGLFLAWTGNGPAKVPLHLAEDWASEESARTEARDASFYDRFEDGHVAEAPLAEPGRCIALETTTGRRGFARRQRTAHRFKEPGWYGAPLDACYHCGGRKP